MLLGMRTSVSTLAITAVISQSFLLGAGDFSAVTPTSTNVSVSRAGNAMIYDSTGKLTYAPNNLTVYSEQFDNAAWIKAAASVTSNSTTAPNGTTTADTLTPDTSNAQHKLTLVASSGSANNIVSVYAKAAGYNWIVLQGSGYAWFDVANGVVGTQTSCVGTITSVGNGWYRCSIYMTAVTSSAIIWAVNGNGVTSFAGDGTSGVYVWGAQLEAVTYQTTPSTYIPTTTSAYYGPRLDYDPSTLAFKGLLVEGSRTNLATYSEQLDNAAWAKSNASVTANAITSPSGTTTSDKIVVNTATSGHYVSQSFTITASTNYVFSTYVQAAEYGWALIYIGSVGVGQYVNLSTGALGSTYIGAPTSAVVTSVGNGWYRVAIGFNSGANTVCDTRVYATPANNTASNTGDGTSGIYIWGAQLEAGSFATSYTPTTTASVTRAAETMTLPSYASQLVVTNRIDEQTGATYYDNIAPGATFTPNNGWISSLRVYTGASAGTQAVPSWLDNSGTTGNRMLYDSTGKLTYAPNNITIYSNEFTNAAWNKFSSTITANSIVSPDGNTNASKVQAVAGSNTFNLFGTGVTQLGGTTYIYSAYVKYGNNQWLWLRDGGTIWQAFDIQNGVLGSRIGTSGTFISANITSVGNGWYRVSLATTAATSTTNNVVFTLGNASTPTGSSVTQTGSEFFYLYGYQFEAVTYQTAPGAYIPTTTAAVYQPRFDYDPSTLAAKGLLIEESRANLVTYSEVYSGGWLTAGSSYSSSAGNAITSPSGLVNGAKLTEDATSARHLLYTTITTVVSTVYTASIYAKAGERTFIALGLRTATTAYCAVFNLTSGSTSTTSTTGSPTSTSNSVTSVGNGWYRISVSMTADATSTVMDVGLSNSGTPSFVFNMPSYSGNGTSSAYIWGAQLEAGSFATSYIPTAAASVTRVADVVKLTGTALTALSGTAASALLETNGINSSGGAGNGRLLNPNGTSSFLGYNGNTQVASWNGSVNVIATLGGSGTFTSTARTGVAWDASPQRSVVGNNGTVASGAGSFSGVTTVYLGGGNLTAYTCCGWYRSLAIYNQRLPDATLKTKSTVGAPL